MCKIILYQTRLQDTFINKKNKFTSMPGSKEVLDGVNKLVDFILKGTFVESYGVLNQYLFIDFKGDSDDNIRFYIESAIEITPPLDIPLLNKEQMELLILNRINLKTVTCAKRVLLGI